MDARALSTPIPLDFARNRERAAGDWQ